MNAAEEIGALEAARPPNSCKTCWELRTAPEELKTAVDDRLAAGGAFVAVAAILARHGYNVTGDNLQKHHRKGHRLS